jgi:tRNA (cmo5U34)-methyltransferase
VNQWPTQQHALDYLAKADRIPHRTEGEAELLNQVPKTIQRILDLGTGDGRLLSLLKIDRPGGRPRSLCPGCHRPNPRP